MTAASCGIDPVGTAQPSVADSGTPDGPASSSSGSSSGISSSSGGSSGMSSGSSGSSSGGSTSSSSGSASGSSSGSSSGSGGGCVVANGCYVVPNGWTLVAFEGNQTAACPSGYTQTKLVENPNVPASACECECSLTQAPSCPSGQIAVSFDQNNSKTCGTTGMPSNWAYSMSCDNNPIDMYHPCALGCPGYPQLDLAFAPPAATGGSCQKSAVQRPQSVTATSDVACAPKAPPCNGSDCTPSFPAPLQVCIVQSGKHGCPAQTFTQPHDVGTGVSYACDAGPCGCTATARCTGTIKLFTNGGCNQGEVDIPADGACHRSGASQSDYATYLYAPNPPANAACAGSGTPNVQGVGLDSEETICCAP